MRTPMPRLVGWSLLAATTIAFAAAGPLDEAAAQSYSLEDLLTLSKRSIENADWFTGRSSIALAATDNGYVAGFSAISGNYSGVPWFMSAVRWDDDGIENLGVLGPRVPPPSFPKPESRAFDVNSLGQVVGRSNQPFAMFQGFLWLPSPAFDLGPGMHALPELPNGATQAYSINDAGSIVGESRPAGSIGPRPVLWTYDTASKQWTITDLGDLGGPYGRAFKVNEKGQVAGEANVPTGSLRSFLWLPTTDYGLPPGMHDIDPSQESSSPRGLNEKGQIVGWIGLGEPYLWLPEPDYGLPAGTNILSLARIPDAVSAWPQAINNDGIIVGQVGLYVYVGGRYVWYFHAIVWIDGQEYLLEDLLYPADDWWLINAYDVTSAGLIVGNGIPPGDPLASHAVRLTPGP
ncbi:MAG: hypothetical protein AB1486_22060 [Planctomycetota bacterium]